MTTVYMLYLLIFWKFLELLDISTETRSYWNLLEPEQKEDR